MPKKRPSITIELPSPTERGFKPEVNRAEYIIYTAACFALDHLSDRAVETALRNMLQSRVEARLDGAL